MRVIENGFLAGGNERYFAVLASMVRLPKNGTNTTYDEMRVSAPLAGKLEAAVEEDHVLVEEAEWRELCERVKSPAAPFVRNSTEALAMCDAVLEARVANVDLVESPPAQGTH